MRKTSVNFNNTVDKAIGRFVKDRDNTEFDKSELVGLTALKRFSPLERLLPQFLPDTPISSNKMIEFVREAKLRINILGSQTGILKEEIVNASADFWSTLDDTQNQLKALDSDIQEEEIKAEDKFQVVHYNAFSRPIDMATKQLVQQIDEKTGLPFLSDQLLQLIPNTGLTLPKVQKEKIFIKDIVLLDEGTDVGDTVLPIVKTNPNNLLDPNLFFRYVIARKTHDLTGRLYNYTESTCSLLLQLGHIQLVNHLNIRPASNSTVVLKQIEYINESGERVQVDISPITIDNGLDIILEPIRTNNIIFTLSQLAPVERTTISTRDYRKDIINKALEGSDWSILLENEGSDLDVKVYDFSLESITLSLVTYKQSGYFLSKDIEVNKPLSFSLTLDTETIQISSVQNEYGNSYFLPKDTVLYETYCKIRLQDHIKRKQVISTIPIPTKKTQTEMLPLIGGLSNTCFVPNLFFSSTRMKVKSIFYITSYAFVELQKEHNIPIGITYTDKLELFVSREDSTLNFISTLWEASTPTLLILKRDDGITAFGDRSENFTPKAYLLRALNANPFSVYRENVLLTLGTDYQYSIDNGVTWFSTLMTLKEFSQFKEAAFAGSFKIKIVNPNYDLYYWITYRRLNIQYLHPNKLFLLKKNSVIVAPRLRLLNGSLQTMIILRADSRIPYLSSIIRNYKLKVRQL